MVEGVLQKLVRRGTASGRAGTLALMAAGERLGFLPFLLLVYTFRLIVRALGWWCAYTLYGKLSSWN